MTIPPNQWGYNSDWKSSYIKTPHDLIGMLMHSGSLNGNLVINFGPDGLGNIRPEEANIAQQVGEWTKKNAEAIYGASYAGLEKPEFGYYTRKGDKLYLTVFNRPTNNQLRLAFPPNFKNQVRSAQLLIGYQALEVKRINMGLSNDNNRYYDVIIPSNFSSTEPFVVVLELNNADGGRNANFGDAKT
jgi:alpha-L-fucosidase